MRLVRRDNLQQLREVANLEVRSEQGGSICARRPREHETGRDDYQAAVRQGGAPRTRRSCAARTLPPEPAIVAESENPGRRC